MSQSTNKVLVLSGPATQHAAAIEALRAVNEVVQVDNIEDAIKLLRGDQFGAIYSDTSDFLPLERALVGQQASLILNTIGEGICIVDGYGHCSWMNNKMKTWPPKVHEKVTRTCKEAFDVFTKQVSPQSSAETSSLTRSKRYALNLDDQQFLELVVSPVVSPASQVVQVVAVVWDATGSRRLQHQMDAIDKAGRELVKLESRDMARLPIPERLKLLEEKIISSARDLMHFDHFMIRLIDPKTRKLETVMHTGLPDQAISVDLYAEPEHNGISGWVAATGRSYICPDVQHDPRYLPGLDQARSSLTVPLSLEDEVIGIFNVESRTPSHFNEDDRQFAEIFGRYVAWAINILNLMRVERIAVTRTLGDNVTSEVAAPLNDAALEVQSLLENYAGSEEFKSGLEKVLKYLDTIRDSVSTATRSNPGVLGAGEIRDTSDTLLDGAQILVADDDPKIRGVIHDVLLKFRAEVTTAANGAEAIKFLEARPFDLVLSDIRMPDKTGYDVFRAARVNHGKVPVILMTGFGYDPEHNVVRASQEGLQAVLFKPFKVDQMLAEVRKGMAVARAQAAGKV